MIDLFDLYVDACGTFNTAQGGHMKPHTNFVQWVKDISIDIYLEHVAEYEKTQIISDALRTFLKSVNVVISPVSGQVYDLLKLPADYKNFASARVMVMGGKACACKGDYVDGNTGLQLSIEDDLKDWKELEDMTEAEEVAIKKVPGNKWSSVLTRHTLKPSLAGKIAYCTSYDAGFKVVPKQIGIAIFDYFREPQHGTFEYTILNPGTENEYIQYNADASVKLDWDSTMKPEFITRLQKKYREATGKF